jgi:two-component system, NtrC family, sensor kinase
VTEPEKNEMLAFYKNLMRSTDAIIIILDGEGRVRAWNGCAEEFFLLPEASAAGKLIGDCPVGEAGAAISRALRESAEKRNKSYLPDMFFVDPEGHQKYLGLKVVPVSYPEGALAGFLVEGKDITLTREIKRQNEESQKFRAIGELAAGIIHEIHTPVQYIKNNLQYLHACRDRLHEVEDIGEVLQSSLEGMDRITTIIKSLKNYAHPGRSKPELFSPRQAIEDALTLSANQWKNSGRIETSFPEENFTLSGYGDLVSQVMVNFIINSCDALVERYGSEAPDKGLISISLGCNEKNIIIKVADNGKGMEDEVKKRIFEPFFTTKPAGKGTGQGLPLAYSSIVGKHGGSLLVDSKKDEGTVITVLLPKQVDLQC